MTSKLARTILILLILLMPILLWATKIEQLPSLSAYALSPNALYYRAMHLFGSWLFLVEGQKFKRHLDMLTGICMGFILIVDVYFSQIFHNIFTAATMGLAVLSIIYYSDFRNLGTNIMIATSALAAFLLGLYLPYTSSVFWGEVFAMFCIAVSRARRVWLYERA